MNVVSGVSFAILIACMFTCSFVVEGNALVNPKVRGL